MRIRVTFEVSRDDRRGIAVLQGLARREALREDCMAFLVGTVEGALEEARTALNDHLEETGGDA